MGEFPGSKDKLVDESRVWVDQNDQATIVIHGTGGSPTQTADQLGDFFETTPAMTSVHYGIDRQGNIDQYVLEKDGAGGNGILDAGHDPFWDQYSNNPNWHSLSVETENDSTNSLPLTDPQKVTLFKLIAYWVKKYNIPLSNIKGHFTLQPVERHNCPGQQFPWAELTNYLNSGGTQPMSTQVPANWHDDGTTLTAPNGHHVTQGFRDYVLNHAWDATNVPLEDVETATAVEDYYVSGSGTRQLFNYTELAWTQARGVYVVGIGNELLGCRKERDALKAEIATLQSAPNVANLLKINGLAAQIVKASQVQ